jgi:tripartite-type tricarboxylate transporter receptor subunit TctC
LGATGAIAVGPHLPDAPPLYPQRDLVPLGKLADIPLVLVASASGEIRDMKSFLHAARKATDGLSYGQSGQYTSQHLAGELLANMAQVRLTAVPYKGSGPAVTDLLGGNIPAAVVDLTSAYPHIKAGKLVALGVTSAKPTKVAPEIPAIAQEGIAGYSAPAWMGLFLPAKTPTDVRAKLSAAMHKVMQLPAVESQITRLAAEPAYMDGPAFETFIAQESKKWAEVVKRIPAPAK